MRSVDESQGDLERVLAQVPVIPVLVIDRIDDAIPVARALADGGLPIAEVTLRTDAALPAIEAISTHVPEVLVGAGTVLSGEHVKAAKAAGAKYIVSPGLSSEVVSACEAAGLPVTPGVATASEVQEAWNLGLRTVKFFPASLAGGPKAIKALGSVFRDMRFIPTGGVTAENLREYFDLPSVIACGGSWLAPAALVEAGDFDAITQRAKEACHIAASETE